MLFRGRRRPARIKNRFFNFQFFGTVVAYDLWYAIRRSHLRAKILAHGKSNTRVTKTVNSLRVISCPQRISSYTYSHMIIVNADLCRYWAAAIAAATTTGKKSYKKERKRGYIRIPIRCQQLVLVSASTL